MDFCLLEIKVPVYESGSSSSMITATKLGFGRSQSEVKDSESQMSTFGKRAFIIVTNHVTDEGTEGQGSDSCFKFKSLVSATGKVGMRGPISSSPDKSNLRKRGF